MEDLEIRQLLTGTLWKVTLVDESSRPDSEQMLTLQDGVPDANDPSIVTASQYEEKPDGTSIEDFMKSLISGTIDGTIWTGDPGVETPVSFAFPQRVSTTAGDAPIYLNQIYGDDVNGYTGAIAVDDSFDYEPSNGHSYGYQEWNIALQPAGHISIAATDDQASENNADAATFIITPTGSAGAYALFTVSGTAICGGTDRGNLTDPNADYVLEGAEAMPGDPGKFKAYFNSYSGLAEVRAIPLNDGRSEETETVEVMLIDDPVTQGSLPAYADPAGNGVAAPAVAVGQIKDLRVQIDPDPNAHTPTTAEIDEANKSIPLLDNDNADVRAGAKTQLKTRLIQNPGLEDTYRAGKQLLGTPGALIAMDEILMSYRRYYFSFDANNQLHIIWGLNTQPPAGTASVVVYAFPDFPNDPILAQEQSIPVYVELAANATEATAPRAFIPQSIGDATITAVISYRDAQATVIEEEEIMIPVHCYTP